MSAARRSDEGLRTYEVHQRMRLDESTALVKPRHLSSQQFLDDPYPILAVLRENYPCYRDWPGNAYWLTRYDDVTSVFVDDANFESRPKRWWYARMDWGRDAGAELAVLRCRAERLDACAEKIAERLVEQLRERVVREGRVDLATEFAARLPIELLAHVLDLPDHEVNTFAERYWRMQRGVGFEPGAEHGGRVAMDDLRAYFEPLLAARRKQPGQDLVSIFGSLIFADGSSASAADLVVTLLEDDHETLHGALANLWFRLLTDPTQLGAVEADGRLLKAAYLETLRHSPPVLSAKRFARHEVERFGRLLPEGAMVVCSAAAANRDPRVFGDPETFTIVRNDLCQREPRGHYRADGLPSGIAFGVGPPSKYPAVPEDRPRSRYAITRDIAVGASRALLGSRLGLRLAPDTPPRLRSLRLGEMHTCWSLPVVVER